jgi:hypothetical protein
MMYETPKLSEELGLVEWLSITERPRCQASEAQRLLMLTAGTFLPNPSHLINEPSLEQTFLLRCGKNLGKLYSTANLSRL